MANKKINELVEKAVINANDLVFVGDPTTGWLYNTTIADLQVGSITGGLAGSGQVGYIPRFKTAQTLENSLLFNGASGIGIGTSASPYYLGLNGDYARTIGLTRSLLGATSGGLGLTILAGGATSGMLNSSGGDLILKSGISTGNGTSAIRLFTSTSGVSGTQDNALIERVSILGNGNTGFGVINPTYKVEVGGNIGNGQYGIDTSFVTFNNAPTSVPTTPGTLRWNDTDGTLEFTMKGGNVTQQIGQELPILVKHADNTGLTEGKVVYSVGSDGSNLTVRYANSNQETTSSTTFGVMTEDATGGSKGFCTTFGLVRDLDTSAMTEGAAIWLDSIDGGMTTTKPIQPKHLVYIGVCLRSHATNGVIFVNVSNGQELDELHDVLIVSKQNNQALIYDSATSLWKNRTIIGANGYIPYWDSTDLYKQSPLFTTSGGSIGLGTTNPFKTFTVIGQIGVYSSATNYGFLDTANNSFGLTSANGFYFNANNLGTVASTIVDNTGKWGFGVGTPSYKVDVNGDVNTNGIYRINGSPLSTTNIAEGTNLYFTSNRVLNQVLTGLNPSLAGTMTATDSLIEGLSKVQYQLNNKENTITAGTTAQYWRGDKTWQTLNTSVVPEGTNLYYTQARFDSAFGAKSTTNLAEGTNLYFTNARAIGSTLTGYVSSAGTVLATDSILQAIQKINGNVSGLVTGVSSVFGRTGAVVAQSGDYTTTQVTEGTNLYYTDARARASNSFVAGSGAYNSTTGVITIPTNTNQLTNGASFITLASLSASSPLSYNNTTGAFSISQANGSTNGYLSSTDWTTFNNKQNALTNPITGTGTTNYLPKFTGSTTLGNSSVYDNGTGIGIGVVPSSVNTSTVEVGYVGNSLTGRSGIVNLALNAYRTATWKYANTGAVSNFELYNGQFDWYNAPSGTAGTDISFSLKMRLDSSGNLGLGVTPSAWAAGQKAFDFGTIGSVVTDGSAVTIDNNRYYDGVSNKYKVTGTASIYNQVSGQHIWYTAPSGTAGTAISFTQAMTLDASGRLMIGTTTADAQLVVNGSSNSRINMRAGDTRYGTFYADAGIFAVAGVGNIPMILGTNDTERVRINHTTGNVSIGNTNNTYKLDVSGTGYFSGVLNLENNSTGTLAGLQFRYLASQTNSRSWKIMTDRNDYGDFTIAQSTTQTGTTWADILYLSRTGAATFSSSVTAGQISTTAGNAISAGGTTFAVSPSSTRGIININGSTDQLLTFSSQSYIYNGASLFRLLSSSDIDFVSGGLQRLLISSSTGAATFSSTLKVNGTPPATSGILSVVTSTSTLGDTANLGLLLSNDGSLGKLSQIGFGYSESRSAVVIGGVISNGGGSTTSDLFFATRSTTVGSDAPTERMRITNGGLVGIATNSPSAQLHVASGNVIIGSAPSSVFKFNVNPTGSNFISFWIPTLDGVNGNGIMSHNGSGYTNQLAMGYQASTHMFNLSNSLTGGGTLQVGGDVNISGTFKVNGTPIGTGGGGISGGGNNGYLARWTSGSSIGDSNIFSTSNYTSFYYSSSTNNPIYFYRDGTEVGQFLLNTYQFQMNGLNNYELLFSSFGTMSFNMKSGSSTHFLMKLKYNTVNIDLPTSSSGLSTGDFYRDALGYVRIV